MKNVRRHDDLVVDAPSEEERSGGEEVKEVSKEVRRETNVVESRSLERNANLGEENRYSLRWSLEKRTRRMQEDWGSLGESLVSLDSVLLGGVSEVSRADGFSNSVVVVSG